MSESECPTYKELKDRENRAHAAWTSFLFRNEIKPRLSEKAKRKHQKEEMEAYERAHKARAGSREDLSIVREKGKSMKRESRSMRSIVLLDRRSADDQHLANVIAREEEFDRCEVVEEILDVPIVEDALQPRRALLGAGPPGART